MVKKIKYLILILLIAFYFLSRLYRLEDIYTFSFDQYRDAWVAKQIIIDRRPTLIGPQSSLYGIFYGPGFYYYLAFFYWLFGLHPLGGAIAAIFFGFASLILLFYLAEEIFSLRVAVITSFIYLFSLQINLLNRDCRNDPPLMAFSLVILLLLHRLSKDKKKTLFKKVSLLGFVAGLGWHFHFAALAFLPLIIFSFWILKVKEFFKNILVVTLSFLITFAPLVIFDFRHHFQISKSFGDLLRKTSSSFAINIFQRIFSNFILVFKNFWEIVIPEQCSLTIRLFFLFSVLFFIAFFLLKEKLEEKKKIYKLFLFWTVFPIFLFSFYQRESRYYFFLLNFPVFIVFLASVLESVFRFGFWRNMAIFFIIAMAVSNLKQLLTIKSPRSLKLTEQAVEFIKKDSQGKPIFVDYFSENDFKVNFDYLSFYYQLNKVEKKDPEKYSSYIIYVPAHKIKGKNYKAIFGEIGVVVVI